MSQLKCLNSTLKVEDDMPNELLVLSELSLKVSNLVISYSGTRKPYFNHIFAINVCQIIPLYL